MARYRDEPLPGYAPVLRIDLRQDDEGGPTLARARADWAGPSPVEQGELLLLVHGFNNHRRQAKEAYLGMRQRQAPAAGSSARIAFEAPLGDVFWPGDARWDGALDKLDFLVYPHAVQVARDEVGPRLAEYLRQRRDVRTVHVLAHSLGCRVALECIAALAEGGGPAVGRVCLMAAAVPTFMLQPGGRLHRALAHAQSVQVLFSGADAVLAGAFPAGQTLADGDEGFFPIALGHAGDVPPGVGAVACAAVQDAAHGDYWGQAQGKACDEAAGLVRRFFGFPADGARRIEPRAVAPARTLAARAAPG